MKTNCSSIATSLPGFQSVACPVSGRAPARPGRLVIALLSAALVVLASQAVLAGTYTVKPGDTLWRIAQAHNVSVEAIQTANNLGESGVVIVGQVLTVPAAATTAPATPPSTPRSNTPAAGAANAGQHVVQGGETLYSIATQYRTTVSALRQLNDLGEDAVLVTGRTLRVPTAGQPAPSTPVTPPGPGAVWHEVQRGDTLSSISRRYSVSLTQLESWNRISREAPLIAGNRLRVGGGTTAVAPPNNPADTQPVASPSAGDRSHTVVRGDTLSSIARAHNVRVAELAAVNQIPVDSMVRIGQILQLPANASAPAPPADVADTTPPPGAPMPSDDTPDVATTDPVESTTPPQPTQPEQPSTTEGVPSQPEVAAQESPQQPPAIADDTEHGATTDTLDAFFSYEIQPEQNLAEVAKIFFTTEAELLRINPRIQTADQARPGERILVPGEGLKKRFASQF